MAQHSFPPLTRRKKILFVLGLLVVIGIILGRSVLWYVGMIPTLVPVALAPESIPIAQFTSRLPFANGAVNSASFVSWKVEPVVENVEVPWSIAFTSPERMIFTERTGKLRVVNNGQLSAEPLITFSEVSQTGEEGLMGLTLHPDYQNNKWIYVSLAYPRGNDLFVKVVRLIDAGDSARVEKVIVDSVPAARFHAGSALRFGPDGKLYITTGDGLDRNQAQNLNSLAGKILRVNDDGTIPVDNPFPNSRIWSYGHRNPQGIDWHPLSLQLYSSEHGPTGFDGPGGGDEVNRIQSGGNYGWPVVSHERTKEGMISPLVLYTPAEAPASGTFYDGSAFPQFTNDYFIGALRGEGLLRLEFSDTDPNVIEEQEKLFGNEYGRIRAVTVGPDGYIYFSTSNRDGRGSIHAQDDHIYRIVPEK